MDAQDSGNLNQKTFLELLVELHQKSATGSLKLERAPLQKAVYFRDGQILFAASNDPQDQLASILVEEGKLSKDQMQVAQARVSAGNPLAKVLTELGYISQRELADAARLKVEKILTDLYGWKEGTFQFVERSLPKGAIDLELSTPRLIFNSVRRIQEREWVLEQLGSLDSVLSATPSLDSFLDKTTPDPSASEVLRLVDGVKSIKQIGALSALGEFEVCKILASALLSGAFEKSAAGDAVADEAASPPAPPPSEASLPFPAEAPVETTALNIGEGESDSAEAGYTNPPAAPLAKLEQAATPPASQPSGDFVFDEPSSTASPEHRRVPPRPRKMKGGGGVKKVLMAGAALVAIGGIVGAAYYFFWGQEEPSAGATGSSATGTPPVAAQAGQTPKPPPSTTAPPTTTPPPSGPTPTSPSTTRPPGPTTGPTTTTTAPPRTPPSSRPTPTSASSRPSTSPGPPLAQGQQQLKSGNYPQAAATFLGQLRNVGTDKFTIAVGVFCDTSNLSRVVQNSGGSKQLLVLSFDNKGRSCYRVFWGIFDSRAEAQRAIASVPASVRARDSAPVPIARLIS
ncbi:MAG: DUF4388 domain-containing protein [Vicinamibacteria bacterium]